MSRPLGLAVVLAASSALAEDVAVQADVVFASTAPGTVDPDLAAMKATLDSRVKYLTLKRLSRTQLTLSGAAPARVPLPSSKVAEILLLGITDNVARLRVKLPPLDATYSLGKDKSLYVQAGPHDGGDLWLVLSQPR